MWQQFMDLKPAQLAILGAIAAICAAIVGGVFGFVTTHYRIKGDLTIAREKARRDYLLEICKPSLNYLFARPGRFAELTAALQIWSEAGNFEAAAKALLRDYHKGWMAIDPIAAGLLFRDKAAWKLLNNFSEMDHETNTTMAMLSATPSKQFVEDMSQANQKMAVMASRLRELIEKALFSRLK